MESEKSKLLIYHVCGLDAEDLHECTASLTATQRVVTYHDVMIMLNLMRNS